MSGLEHKPIGEGSGDGPVFGELRLFNSAGQVVPLPSRQTIDAIAVLKRRVEEAERAYLQAKMNLQLAEASDRPR